MADLQSVAALRSLARSVTDKLMLGRLQPRFWGKRLSYFFRLFLRPSSDTSAVSSREPVRWQKRGE